MLAFVSRWSGQAKLGNGSPQKMKKSRRGYAFLLTVKCSIEKASSRGFQASHSIGHLRNHGFFGGLWTVIDSIQAFVESAAGGQEQVC